MSLLLLSRASMKEKGGGEKAKVAENCPKRKGQISFIFSSPTFFWEHRDLLGLLFVRSKIENFPPPSLPRRICQSSSEAEEREKIGLGAICKKVFVFFFVGGSLSKVAAGVRRHYWTFYKGEMASRAKYCVCGGHHMSGFLTFLFIRGKRGKVPHNFFDGQKIFDCFQVQCILEKPYFQKAKDAKKYTV